MELKIGAVAASILLITGCTHLGSANKYQPYPQAQWPASHYQDKLQSAQHWDVLAKNEAKLIGSALPKGSVIAFKSRDEHSSFGVAYRKLLVQHLLSEGMRITTAANGIPHYTLDYEVQVVHHQGRDKLRPPAGVLSAVTGSAWLVAHAADNWGTPGLVAIPFAIAGDAYLATNRDAPTPDTEALITTNIYRGDMIEKSSTHIYYFNEGDAALYASERGGKGRTIWVTDKP